MSGEFKTFRVEGGLENLLRRLERGMKLTGRIVECAGDDLYLLRIRGFNILTRSKKRFDRFEEVGLRVKEVFPYLILEMHPEGPHRRPPHPARPVGTDILVD